MSESEPQLDDRREPSAQYLADRRQLIITIVALVVTAASLIGVAFMWFLATLMTFGLYSWQDAQIDGSIWIPLLGVAVLLPTGPLVMSLGTHKRRWRLVAAWASVAGVVVLSLVTWVPVALGWR